MPTSMFAIAARPFRDAAVFPRPAVCNSAAQINLASAAAANLLTKQDMATYQAGLAWVADMRSAWASMAENGVDIGKEANWPKVPPGVQELADRF